MYRHTTIIQEADKKIQMCVCVEREREIFQIKRIVKHPDQLSYFSKEELCYSSNTRHAKSDSNFISITIKENALIHLTTLAKGQDYTGLDQVIHLPLYTSH